MIAARSKGPFLKAALSGHPADVLDAAVAARIAVIRCARAIRARSNSRSADYAAAWRRGETGPTLRRS